MEFINKEGEVILLSDDVSLKITSDRDLFVKFKKDGQFKSTGKKVPIGMSREEKELFLLKLRQRIINYINEVKKRKQEESEADK